MPFEKGNKLAAKSKEFKRRMLAAIEQDEWQRVRAGLERVLDLCASGERWALEMVRDTLDGKPAIELHANDGDGNPLAIALVAYHPAQVQPPALPAPDPEGAGLRH